MSSEPVRKSDWGADGEKISEMLNELDSSVFTAQDAFDRRDLGCVYENVMQAIAEASIIRDRVLLLLGAQRQHCAAIQADQRFKGPCNDTQN